MITNILIIAYRLHIPDATIEKTERNYRWKGYKRQVAT